MKSNTAPGLINIIGIDGAGKTTLAKALATELAKTDRRVTYAYAQYFARLLWPVKQAARLLFMGGTDEFNAYARYNEKKQGTSKSHPRLSMIYGGLWVLDYLMQVFFKVTLRMALGKRLVLDRYLFDIAVNLSLTLGRDKHYAAALARFMLNWCPRPHTVILVDLPEDVAFERKTDIQDLFYLTQRRERYLFLAQEFGFAVIDGNGSKETVMARARAALAQSCADKGPGKARVLVTDNGPDHRQTILYVHANNTDVGGADFCLFKLAAALDPEVFRPVVCLSRETAVADLYRKKGIKTWILPMTRIQSRLSPSYLLGLAKSFPGTVKTLRQIICLEKAELVHGNDLLDIYGPVAARLEKVPSIQYVRWIMVSPAWLKILITGLVYRLNDRVMTVSRAVARHMFSKKGQVLPRVRVCYDWLDQTAVGHGLSTDKGRLRREFNIPITAPVVGCVGRLETWKGQDLFIRAAARVHAEHPFARFLVVGGDVAGRGREGFATLCRNLSLDLGLEDRIIFTGHRSDMGQVMAGLDILVHSSRTPDPLPGVVMEAMAAGLPVVGADAGGVPEEMQDKETGLLYKAGDHRAMARKIAWLLSHPEKAASMGQAGQQRAAYFTQTVHVPRIQAVYEDLIENSNMLKNNHCRTGKSYPGFAGQGETHA